MTITSDAETSTPPSAEARGAATAPPRRVRRGILPVLRFALLLVGALAALIQNPPSAHSEREQSWHP